MIFVDSGAWYALLDAADPNHRRATSFHQELARGAHGRLVTSDYVLDETYTLCRLRGGHAVLETMARLAEEAKSLEVLWVTESDFSAALKVLLERKDKRWSFTDCTSFVLMEAMGLKDAFSFDENFRQAGLQMLPRLHV